MPTRLIREGFLDSDPLRAAGELAEVLFTRLMLVADDYGRFDGRVTVICRRCWPLGGPSEDSVAERLAALAANGLVVVYEVDGKPFICIQKFRQRLRVKNASKYPDPPDSSPRNPQPPVKPPPSDGHATDGRALEVHAKAEVHNPPASATTVEKSPAPSDSAAALAEERLTQLQAQASASNVEGANGTPAGILAAVCMRNSIRATAFNPLVVDWARDGVTVEQLRAAIATARMRKPAPENIPLSYLDPILGDRVRPKVDVAWRGDDAKAEALCRDLGIPGAKIREERPQWHARIEQALSERARSHVA